MPSVVAQRLRAFAFDHGGLLFVATLIIYVWVTPHHVGDCDNAEFVTIAAKGGVPHPTGNPLYLLWLRAMSWLPGASAAQTAAIATAILGAATVLVLHAACRAWGARGLAATVAVFAAAPVVIRISTEAEVFALDNFVSEDYLYFGSAYVQSVREARRDVVVISWGQLVNADYRARLHARHGIVDLEPGDPTPATSVANDVLARGRPLFVDPAQARILRRFPSYPFGILYRVLPLGAPIPAIHEVLAMNQALYAGFDLQYPLPSGDDDFAAHVHQRYARMLRVIAGALAAAGDRPQAAAVDELAASLAPWTVK